MPSSIFLAFSKASREIGKIATRGILLFPNGIKSAFVGTCLALTLVTTGGCGTVSIVLQHAIESEKGWTAFSLDEIQNIFPDMNFFEPSSQSLMASILCEEVRKKGVKFRTVPPKLYDKHFSGSVACYDPQNKIIYISADTKCSADAIHEIGHALQKSFVDESVLKGCVTEYMQTALAMEAGAFALQTVMSYQEYLNGNKSPFTNMLINGSQFEPRHRIALALLAILDQHPSFEEQIKDKRQLPPPDVMDLLMYGFLTNGSIAPHLNDYTEKFNENINKMRRPPEPNYTPGNFSPDDIVEITFGNFYPPGTRFPLTEEAVKQLSEIIVPFLKAEIKLPGGAPATRTTETAITKKSSALSELQF